MIRVLHCVNIMDRAGLETMLMNYYRNIDRNEIQFDFLTHRDCEGAYDDEIKSLGGKIYHAPRLYPQNYIKYFKWMKLFFKQHTEYRIVHSHIDAMSFFPLLAAKKAGVPIRIAHSHSSKLDYDLKFFIKYISLKLIRFVSNVNFACGEKAGKFMFGGTRFNIIKNAIDLNKFKYDKNFRNFKRSELGIPLNSFVIGHVGRYCYIKNQLFILEVFKIILSKCSNSFLLLVGNGPDELKIKLRIKELELEGNVILLKNRDDVNELYQTMDVFIMPSLFEGLPVVGVEAQANGLSCVFSSSISHEIKLTNNVKFLDLNEGANSWSDCILTINRERELYSIKSLNDSGYCIKQEAEKLARMYHSLFLN